MASKKEVTASHDDLLPHGRQDLLANATDFNGIHLLDGSLGYSNLAPNTLKQAAMGLQGFLNTGGSNE